MVRIPTKLLWKNGSFRNREPTLSENSRLGIIELMESATILTPSSTGLSGILLSVRTQSCYILYAATRF